MKNEKKQKIKNFFLKCILDKKTNDFVFTLLFIPLLVIGLIIGQPALYILGGIALSIINSIIKKVVSERVKNVPIDILKKGDKK